MVEHHHRYWDEIAGQWSDKPRQRLWRNYCDRLNGRLIEQWLSDLEIGWALKTDLFDEAVSQSGLVGTLHHIVCRVVGIDVSHRTCRTASDRFPALEATTADARRLPFADGSFDLVVSNSTLDHFTDRRDIGVALAELHRILRPEGHLLLTLDNLANPVIALRSALPQRVLSGLRLVPYYVGATYGPRRLKQMIDQSGFRRLRSGVNMHCPRLPAVVTANLLDRNGGSNRRDGFVEFLLSWEVLERLPTRYLSGYFLTVLAERPRL